MPFEALDQVGGGVSEDHGVLPVVELVCVGEVVFVGLAGLVLTLFDF